MKTALSKESEATASPPTVATRRGKEGERGGGERNAPRVPIVEQAPKILILHLLLPLALQPLATHAVHAPLLPALLHAVLLGGGEGGPLLEAELARVPPVALEVLPEARVLELDGVLADLRDEEQDERGAQEAQAARDVEGVLRGGAAVVAGGLDVGEDVGLETREGVFPG